MNASRDAVKAPVSDLRPTRARWGHTVFNERRLPNPSHKDGQKLEKVLCLFQVEFSIATKARVTTRFSPC